MSTKMELTLEQTQQGVSYEVSVLSDIEYGHGPSDAMHNPPGHSKVYLKKTLVFIVSRRLHAFPIDFRHSELVGNIEKSGSQPSPPITKIQSCTIESKAKIESLQKSH
ncbi:hypothetical protein Tco_1507330 [Tanacetum coccineum]